MQSIGRTQRWYLNSKVAKHIYRNPHVCNSSVHMYIYFGIRMIYRFKHCTDWTRYLELTPSLVLVFGSVATMKTQKGNSYGFPLDTLWFSWIGEKIHNSLPVPVRIACCTLAGPRIGMMLDVLYKAFQGSYVKADTENNMKICERVDTWWGGP